MALDQRGERHLRRLALPRGEPFEQLAVAQSGDGPLVEQRVQRTRQDTFIVDKHRPDPPRVISAIIEKWPPGGRWFPYFWRSIAKSLSIVAQNFSRGRSLTSVPNGFSIST